MKTLSRLLLLTLALVVRPNRDSGADALFSPSAELLERGIQVREHRIQGVEVIEVVLGKAAFDARLPALVYFHGRGGDVHLPRGAHQKIEQPYRLFLPRGPLSLGNGRAWATPSVRHPRRAQLEKEILEAADRMIDVIDELRRTRSIAGEPILAGFSQGGMLALAIAARSPDRVSTVIPIASQLVVSLDPERLERHALDGRALPEIHALHGEADRIVYYDEAKESLEALRSLGFVVTHQGFAEVGHEVSSEMSKEYSKLLRAALKRALERAIGIGV
ncbi:MAG: alpha/beta fold hydrolase [Sandaracinaceae bacterium]|nr:alpha/beta fold hydrolase [Sandaracinaceae bacterium]